MNNKRLTFTGLIISFVLLIIPNFNMIDPLPDFLAYFFFAYLIGKSTEIVPYLADILITNGVTFAKDTDVPSKWISVEDGMPEPMVWVLCACRANIIEVLRYDRNIDGWGTAGPNRGYMKSFVTHWMPLPEPPGGDAE